MFFMKKKREIVYFFITLVILLSVVYLLTSNLDRVYQESKIRVEKRVISLLAEVREKEHLDLIKGLDYESEEDLIKVIEILESKGYIVEKDFFWSSKWQFFTVYGSILAAFFFMAFTNTIVLTYEKKRYLGKLDNYIDSLVDHKFDVKLDDRGEDMVSKVNVRFNRLGQSLKRSIFSNMDDMKNMRNSLADISHQIKTPLTSLSMNNDIILDNENLTEEQIEFLDISQGQISRLRWLTDSLLKLSKLDSNTVNFNKEVIPALQLTESFEDVLKNQLREKDLKIVRSGAFDMTLNVDFGWTREALLNIVKNATEHAYVSTKIELVFVDNPSYKGIEIYNYGDLISQEELTKVFQRFYKSTSNTNPESIGIGLNLSKRIIEAQGGIVNVKNDMNRVKFSILFLKI